MKITSLIVAGLVILSLALPASADIGSQLGWYEGPMTMQYSNWDVGTLYTSPTGGLLADSTYTGAALAGLTQTSPPNSFGGESSWGVAQLKSIVGTVGLNTNFSLWNYAQAGTPQITAIFWGEKDTSVTVTNGGNTQAIAGVGVHVAFFENPANTDYNSINPIANGGTAQRTAADVFTGLAQAGYTCIWTLNSVPGKNALDMSNEFFDTYNPEVAFGGIDARGGFYANVGTIYDPNLPGGSLTGVDNGMFVPETLGGPDWDVNWTGRSLLGPNGGGFDVRSDDPVYAEAVPAPAAVFLGMMGLGLVGWLKKRAA